MKGTIAYAKYHKSSKKILEKKIIIEENFICPIFIYLSIKIGTTLYRKFRSNKIFLYECLEFPYRWKKSILIDGFPELIILLSGKVLGGCY